MQEDLDEFVIAFDSELDRFRKVYETNPAWLDIGHDYEYDRRREELGYPELTEGEIQEHSALIDDEYARRAAKELNVDGMGMHYLDKVAPAVIYVAADYIDELRDLYSAVISGGEEIDTLRGKSFQLGVCHEVERSIKRRVGPRNALSIGGGLDERISLDQRGWNVAEGVNSQLSKKVLPLFTGLVYHGRNEEGDQLLYFFVDTTKLTEFVKEHDFIQEAMKDMISRYGVDKTFFLSASKALEQHPSGQQGDMHVEHDARLITYDSKLVDLKIEQLI